MTLHECRPGWEVRVHDVAVGGRDRIRLRELGVVPGARLRVVTRGVAGGLVVAVGDTRVALAARMGRLLRVELAEAGQ